MIRAAMLVAFSVMSALVNSFAKPAVPPMVSLANEKVLVGGLTDSSALQTLDGWPADPATQKLLLSHFDELRRSLIAEFRRCEKFGYYEVVDDSAAASVRILITLRPHSFVKDTLGIPVRIELRHRVGIDTYSNSVSAFGIYKAQSKPRSPLHYLDNLLADYRRSFPYRKLVALFYPAR